MQLTNIAAGLVSALMIGGAAAFPSELAGRSVVSQCVSGNDCCFSTKGACNRQSKSYTERYIACPRISYCPSLGVSWENCRSCHGCPATLGSDGSSHAGPAPAPIVVRDRTGSSAIPKLILGFSVSYPFENISDHSIRAFESEMIFRLPPKHGSTVSAEGDACVRRRSMIVSIGEVPDHSNDGSLWEGVLSDHHGRRRPSNGSVRLIAPTGWAQSRCYGVCSGRRTKAPLSDDATRIGMDDGRSEKETRSPL
ncbi:hypothetical protein CSOJ01_09799 [Colletotrichum sojae]|uniref:Uncharacterized protein n=1 Tax=Colletotrichum sojae TaxID=2175907 RepID=A0A8H6MQ52_9PEZI|nr:hypothetical protein CSOJ01_09799 [Colletotrichum sojae]